MAATMPVIGRHPAEELGAVVHVAGQEDRDALGLEAVDGGGRDVVTGATGDGVPALAGGGVHVEHVELAAGVAVAQPQDRLRPVGVHEVDREVAAGDELELRVVVEDRVVGLAGAERVAGVGGVAGHRRDPVELVGLELLGAEDVDAEGPDPGDGADVARAGRGVPRVVPARRGVLAAEHVEGADLEGHRLARGLALSGPAQRGVDLGLAHVDDHPAGDDLLRLRLLGRLARRPRRGPSSSARRRPPPGRPPGRAACAASWPRLPIRGCCELRLNDASEVAFASFWRSPTVTTTAVVTHTRRTVTRGRMVRKGLSPRRRRCSVCRPDMRGSLSAPRRGDDSMPRLTSLYPETCPEQCPRRLLPGAPFPSGHPGSPGTRGAAGHRGPLRVRDRSPGGFVGVDVFFVISGFLITSLLMREVETPGRHLAARLLRPAGATHPAGGRAGGGRDGRRLGRSAPAGRRCSRSSRTPSGRRSSRPTSASPPSAPTTSPRSEPPSPLQHYWSLSVEEQFYLVWPLLLVGASRWPARARQAPGTTRPRCCSSLGAEPGVVRLVAVYATYESPTRPTSPP